MRTDPPTEAVPQEPCESCRAWADDFMEHRRWHSHLSAPRSRLRLFLCQVFHRKIAEAEKALHEALAENIDALRQANETHSASARTWDAAIKKIAAERDVLQSKLAEAEAKADYLEQSRERVRVQLSNEMDRLVRNVRIDVEAKWRATLTEATKALEWYGDRKPYRHTLEEIVADELSEMERDGGQRAREALLLLRGPSREEETGR